MNEQRLFDYYDNKLKESDANEVKAWIESSQENRQEARRIYSLLLALDVQRINKQSDTEKALKEVKRKGSITKSTNNWLVRLQRVAAVLFLPLIAYLAWQQNLLQDNKQIAEIIEIRSNPGITTRFTLPDSTLVYLNSSSTLSYPSRFEGKTRSVQLSGEAYFEVTKDPEHRFIVHTPDQSAIEVHGTKFNVEAYPDEPYVTTTLTEGKIEFLYGEKKERKRTALTPGQKLVYHTATGELSRSQTSGIPELSWKEGLIIFENTPLEEALHMLEKRFNVDFILTNPALRKDRFTGTFSTQRLERILRHFEISSHIHWRYSDNQEINQKRTEIEIY